MIGLLRSEWIKWRSLRSSWSLWISIVALTIVVGALFAFALAYASQQDGATFTQGDALLALGGNPLLLLLTFVLLAVIGALIVTTEFSQNTIAPTFLNTPKRIPVIVAKFLLATAIGMVTASIAQVIVIAIGSAALAFGDITLPSTSTVLTQFVETATYGACGVLFGFAVGILLRQSVFAVVACIIWAVLIEPIGGAILGGVLSASTANNITRFLPITALDGLRTLDRAPDAPALFQPFVALAIFLAWIALGVVVGSVLVNRADTR